MLISLYFFLLEFSNAQIYKKLHLVSLRGLQLRMESQQKNLVPQYGKRCKRVHFGVPIFVESNLPCMVRLKDYGILTFLDVLLICPANGHTSFCTNRYLHAKLCLHPACRHSVISLYIKAF